MSEFDAGDRNLPEAPVALPDDTRDQMLQILAGIVCGLTPEEIYDALGDGFPRVVEDMLARQGERDEMRAHLDLLLNETRTLLAPVEAEVE